VAFAWLHQRGGMAAVVLTSILVLCVTSVLLFRLVRRRCGNGLLAIMVMFLVTGGSAIHWLARPHLFTLLFAVIFYSILGRVKEGNVRLLWLLPPLTVLWTNLHGGFFVGMVLIGAYAAGELAGAVVDADAGRRARAIRASRPYLAAAAGCFAASFINPYTYRLHAHIFEYLTDKYQFKNIVEFQSFNFHHPVALFFEPMLVLGLCAVVWNLSQRRFVYAFLIAGWAHLALIAVRNAPIFMIVAAPPVAAMLQELLLRLPNSTLAQWLRAASAKFAGFAAEFGEIDGIARVHLVSAGAMALLMVLFYAPNPPSMCRAEYDAQHYPIKAVELLRNAKLSSTVFTDDEWGDYLIYRLYPQNKVFIDGRSDFYGSKFNEKYLDVMNVKYDWEKDLAQYHVDTILLSPNASLSGTLKESRRWTPIYDDGVAIVFRANGRVNMGRDPVSAVANGGKDRDREITKSQQSDRRITRTYLRSEPS
jgi:hypothetical protein